MATLPTRPQQQARDHLAEALFLLSTAHRLDGRSPVGRDDFETLVQRIVKISSAYGSDEIIALAIERRTRSLGLSASAVELIMLVERDTQPWETLMLSDQPFLEFVKSLEAELGME